MNYSTLRGKSLKRTIMCQYQQKKSASRPCLHGCWNRVPTSINLKFAIMLQIIEECTLPGTSKREKPFYMCPNMK